MLITAAEERKKGLTALYIDGEYAVSVDSLTFAGSVFRVGSEITDEQLYELIRLSDVNRAKEKALYLFEYRPRSTKEVEDKLVPLFGEDASQSALSRLEELGLIDDEAFARRYARQLFENKHFPAKRVSFELMKKGIREDLAEAALEDAASSGEKELILKIIRKRIPDPEKAGRKDVEKCKAYLYRQGFRMTDIIDGIEKCGLTGF